MRLYDCLRERGLTNRQIKQAFATGKIRLCGVPTADGGRDVDACDVTWDPHAPRLVVGRDPVLVYYDADVVVAYKPSGWLAAPALGRRREDDMVSWARRLLGEAHAVHRLDEGTSGLLMIAAHEAAQRTLKLQLAEHIVQRTYLALVRHNFPPGEQTYDTHFIRNRGDGKRGSAAVPGPQAKRAITHVRCLERLARNASLVEAELETGRTHQVRVHLSEAGFPILGDGLYGGHGIARAAPRLALHAHRLRFLHPADGEPCTFVAPLADDLERLCRVLRHSVRR